MNGVASLVGKDLHESLPAIYRSEAQRMGNCCSYLEAPKQSPACGRSIHQCRVIQVWK